MPPKMFTSITLPIEEVSYIEAWKERNKLKSNASAVKHMFEQLSRALDELQKAREEIESLKAERDRTMRIIEALSRAEPATRQASAKISSSYRAPGTFKDSSDPEQDAGVAESGQRNGAKSDDLFVLEDTLLDLGVNMILITERPCQVCGSKRRRHGCPEQCRDCGHIQIGPVIA